MEKDSKCLRKYKLLALKVGLGEYKKYSIAWKKELKELIRERDSYKCQICQNGDSKEAHCVHHIDEDKMNCDFDNLVTLCRTCHTILHNKKGDLIEILKESLIEGFIK